MACTFWGLTTLLYMHCPSPLSPFLVNRYLCSAVLGSVILAVKLRLRVRWLGPGGHVEELGSKGDPASLLSHRWAGKGYAPRDSTSPLRTPQLVFGGVAPR